jgi:competence protein ComEA
MPTPAERRALLFLSGILLLGVGVRAVAAVRGAPPPADARALRDLHQQILAVDSARASAPKGKGKRPRSRTPVARRAYGTTDSARAVREKPSAVVPLSVDMDRADEAQIEALPKVGPSLARRIVANRDSLGPFGSMEGLRRVRGVGAAVAQAIAPYVTFSTPPRPSGVDDRGSSARAGGRRRGRKPRSS